MIKKNLFWQVDFEKNLDCLNQETAFIQKKQNPLRTKTPFFEEIVKFYS
jgi:hypothetical protein